ncbi:predicted protein [Nematostella vectensis]|uniref:Uncharacterized protein n=1 Tax=Nematostella vectensis TaxID=45351 RepID=A7RY61_NEMVE|nr:predicted protein [Nematostella vectensis]|eukprot:XP_001635706.1 predicted protein [Nematostella vectensis]
MFIIVRYGDDSQLLCNINCRSRVLYESIKDRCECQTEDVIDLADETGTLKNLSDRPIQQYALEYLTSRASYILMKVKKSEDALGVESKSYEPLLRGIQENNPDFMAKVYNKKINPDVTQSAPTRVTSSLPSKQPIKSSKTSRSQTKAAPSNARLNVGGKGKRLH